MAPAAVPKPSAPDPIAASTTTSSRPTSSTSSGAPSTDSRSQRENPDMSSRHPCPQPHSGRPVDATDTVQSSTAYDHTTTSSQPVPTVHPYRESSHPETFTTDGPNVALRPSIVMIPSRPVGSKTIGRYSSAEDADRSLMDLASLRESSHVETAAQATDQNSHPGLPTLFSANAPLNGTPEQSTTVTHHSRSSIFANRQSKNLERPTSFSASASFQPITTDASPPKIETADRSIPTLLTDADSAIIAPLIPSAAQDLGLLISMALAGNDLTSTLAPTISDPTLLTDADSIVPASLTITAARNLGPSASMAISKDIETLTLRSTLTSATPKSRSFTSLIDSLAQPQALGSQASEERTTASHGLNPSTTPLNLVDGSKPSLASPSASSIPTTLESPTSTVSTLSSSHPVSNAAEGLAAIRHVSLAMAVFVLMWYCLIL